MRPWMQAVEYIHQYDLADTEHLINGYLHDGKKVLCEGAQGTMLDVDFGSYRFDFGHGIDILR